MGSGEATFAGAAGSREGKVSICPCVCVYVCVCVCMYVLERERQRDSVNMSSELYDCINDGYR